jgi:HK97 family phage prohead protease
MTEAAFARRDGYAAPADRPTQRRMADLDDAPRAARASINAPVMRATSNGGDAPHVTGLASVTEQGYEMYDMFGPYTEVISAGAFDKTLAANPLVEFTLNHNRGGGLPMAHTRNGTLTLSMGSEGDLFGLLYDAEVDPTRSDVADMLKALIRGDLAEASFKFRIVRGLWSPDYTEYRIDEVDLQRGDVSAVNFGANPLATSSVRDQLTAPAAKARIHVHDFEVEHRH